MGRLGRNTIYVPIEDQPEPDPSPIEEMLAEAEPTLAPMSFSSMSSEDEVVHRPWEPTGDETPKKTVELDRTSAGPYTVPPPETAGGSIPSGYAQFRKFGPDEA